MGKSKEVGKDVVKMGNDATGTSDLFKLAKDGDMKKFMTYQPKSINDTDSMGLKLLKNIPVTATKYALSGPALLTGVGKATQQGLSDIESKASNTDIEGGKDAIWAAAKSGDLAGVWGKGGAEDEDGNPLSGFSYGAHIGTRLIASPIALVVATAKGIGKGLSTIGKTVVNGFKLGGEDIKLAFTGYPKKLWKNGLEEEDKENPLWGFNYATSVGHKLVLTPISMVTFAGRKIYEALKIKIAKMNRYICKLR